ncbi:MAG: winged helix-turn-helix transcriptional regulator [Chitinophagaceae bacterium]|nr:winged helix-turn-helix transcriptional regulator [Chitinophagaceae bacterium]
MNVKSFNSFFRRPELKTFAIAVVSLCTIFLLAAFVTNRSDGELISKRANIAVRAIGHDLLLRSGDSTSIIRPVIEKPNHVFLLEFENEFVFQPDTLVAIAQRILDKTGLSRYTVTVHECDRPEIVYGFEINPPINSIMSCRGRIQPKACYTIEIAFADFPDAPVLNSQRAMMISGILSLLAIVLISRNLGSKKSKPVVEQNASIQNGNNSILTIGRFVFDINHQSLRMGEETISLTDKECSILMLLNKNIGQLTLREELIQEVWTDEGVITGRSLDMFISKLRKKLSTDPDLRITNVHGKGYRLEIVNDAIA